MARRLRPVRRLNKSGLPSWLIVALLLLAMPVLIPIGMVQHTLRECWMRAAARRRDCPACGVVLGVEALLLADERWQAYAAGLHRDKPGMRFRWVREGFAICTRCGASLGYDEKTMAFEPVSER